MQLLKTNWQSELTQPGFFLLLALLLVDLNYFFNQCVTSVQKVVSIGIACYLLFLLIKKYRHLRVLVFIVIVFSMVWGNLANQKVDLTNVGQISLKIYPDQVKIDDGWLSGTAHCGKQEVLISGNINKNDQKIIESGQTVNLIKVTGDIDPIDPATNYGEFDYRKFYASKNIFQRMRLSNFTLTKVSTTPIAWLHRLRFKLKSYIKKMPKLLGFFTSELLLAENPTSDDQIILNNYRDLGVIHLLSISGLHVGIYTLVIGVLCSALKLTREKAFGCCLFVLLGGIFLSGGQAGFIRASLTYFLSGIFSFKNRKISSYDLLGLTCLVHLLLQPHLMQSVGAILSYILVLGLQLTSNLSEFKQSCLLNLFLTPMLLFYFFQFNLLTVIFNLVVVPYFNYIVMPIVFINLILFNFFPNSANFWEVILQMTEKVIGQISKTKLGLLTFGKINWWQCLLLLFLTSILLILINDGFRMKLKRKLAVSLALLYGIFFATIHFPLTGQVTFIDVGQGDSILISTPFPRKVYLIDTGGKVNFSGKKTTPQVNRITLPFLKAQGITQIDGIFLSHQDADHVGDLGPLLEQIRVKKLYMIKGIINNPSFAKRLEGRVKNTKLVELLAGMQVKEPKINFQVVYPLKPGLGKNEDSLSITFSLAHKRWLFTGDLPQAGEQEIMQNYQLHADYFKLGHHGSKTASNPEFLAQLNPRMVFISAGRNNRYGHPNQETLDTLKKQQIPWVSTQDCGMISWIYDNSGRSRFKYFWGGE